MNKCKSVSFKESKTGIFLIVLFFFFVSCTRPPQTHESKPVLPAEDAAVDSLALIPSVITLPISIKTSVIEDILNSQINGLLYECDTSAIGVVKPVKIKVWKSEPIRVSLDNTDLNYCVALKIMLGFSFTVGAFGFSHTEYQDVEAALRLKFRSHLTIKNNWKISTATQAEGYEWISDPVVKVRFLTVPIKPVADLLLEKQQQTISAIVDKQIENAGDIKNMIKPFWTQMQNGFMASKDPRIWLRLTPAEVYMTQLQGVNGTITGSIGIKSVVETFLEDLPAKEKDDTIRNFMVPRPGDSGFVLNMYCETNYDALTLMLRGLLVGREFKSGKREVIVQDITVTGVKGYLLIGLDLIGSYNGRIYVYGQPVFDKATSTVSVKDLNFDLSTQNTLHKAANWLLHGIILSSVKPYLRFPLHDKLEQSRHTVQKILSHTELYKGIYIEGSVDSLNVAGIRLTDDAIRASIYAHGAVKLKTTN